MRWLPSRMLTDLVADRARGPVVVVIFLAVIVVAVLGMRYANQDAAGRWIGRWIGLSEPVFAGISP